jgi:DNA-binding SARP family transcriptional activator/tetratricopeptide (TPR) repeat protein
MARLGLTVLGGFHAKALPSGAPVRLVRKKAQALLAYLALPAGRSHSRERLIALLWPEAAEADGRNSLRVALSALRSALGASGITCLRVESDGVAVDPAGVEVDALVFEQLIGRGDPASLVDGCRRYAGELLATLDVREEPFDEWLRTERQRLGALALRALNGALALQVHARDHDAVLTTALRSLAMDPLQESAHRAAMRAHAQLGRYGSALRQYQACVDVLQRELGVAPDIETQALYRQILTRELKPDPPKRHRHPHRVVADPALATPLIGRDEETARLRETLVTVRRGRGRCVILHGEAGIGKTRLVAELAARAARSGFRVLTGRAWESERILGLRPWVDACRTGDVFAEEHLLESLSPFRRAELARLFPELGAPPAGGVTGDPYGVLFEAVAEVLERLAGPRPVLCILEDLHWADELSARLLAFVARRIAGQPILLVATVRDEELDAGAVVSRAIEELRSHDMLTSFTLAPLVPALTTDLVRALLGRRVAERDVVTLAASVWTASRGNPFMIVETIRSLGETGHRAAAEPLALPRRVLEVVTARLDRLSERAQRLVATAAVIAREFDFPLLYRASALTELEAAEGTEELVRRRVLHGVGERFDFTHDWVREAAYARVAPLSRRLLHVAVAGAIEDGAADALERHYPELAEHYRRAERWDAALVHHGNAGRAAIARGRFAEAVESLELALDALGHLNETRATREQAIDIRLDLRRALQPLGLNDRIIERAEEADRLARALGDARRRGWAQISLCSASWVAGQSVEARHRGEEALALAQECGDRPLAAAADIHIGGLAGYHADYRVAIAHLRSGLAALEGDRARERFGTLSFPAVLGRGYLCGALTELGEFDEAIRHGRDGLALAEDLQSPFSMLQVTFGLSYVHTLRGHTDESARLLERGLIVCREHRLSYLAPQLMTHLGHAYALSGRVHEGLALLEEAGAQASALRHRFYRSKGSVWLAEAQSLAHQPDRARELAHRALASAVEDGERAVEAWARRALAEIAYTTGDTETSEREFCKSLARAGDLGMRPLVAHCHHGLGRLHQHRGQRPLAQQHLAIAVSMMREMDMGLWRERAEADASLCGME